jgi:hypothetical protein
MRVLVTVAFNAHTQSTETPNDAPGPVASRFAGSWSLT